MGNEISMKYFQWVRLYTERYGWTVIPVRDKQPLVKWGQYREQRPGPGQYRDWWLRDFPCAGIAVLTGAPSMNVVILDVDPRNGDEGQKYVDSIIHWGDHWTRTSTPSGGTHYFFRADRPVRTFNSFRPGLDIKGDNGYALLPPTVNKKGQYTWLNSNQQILFNPLFPALPEEVYAEIAEKENQSASAADSADQAAAIFEFGVEEGGRNIALTKLAGRYFSKGLSRAEVRWLLEGANRACRPPLPKDELNIIVASMEAKHAKRMAWANSIEG